MNVDEALKVAKREGLGWYEDEDAHTAAQVLVDEVERLRAELAAAKAASVCPVKVLNIFEGTGPR